MVEATTVVAVVVVGGRTGEEGAGREVSGRRGNGGDVKKRGSYRDGGSGKTNDSGSGGTSKRGLSSGRSDDAGDAVAAGKGKKWRKW